MKKRKLLFALFGLTFALSLASCSGSKGEKGDTGATGPQGETGPQGTQGPAGSDATQYYPVTFRNEDGSFIDAQFVEKGQSATFDYVPSSSKGYSYKFTGWDKELNNITEPTTITAQYDHSKIYMGRYPQEEVESESLITELNELAGDLPTSTDTKAWTDYNYYISGSIESYMYYQDIDYDNNGDYDYRGVYFTQYRPKYIDGSSSTANSSQDDNGYNINTVYWFEYNPIEWDILDAENGKAFIVSNVLLDAQEFYTSEYDVEIDHNGGIGYPNNYALSNIRKWLNSTFTYDSFNILELNNIYTTEVDNSPKSSMSETNEYYCENTFDKIFLLSYQEVLTYIPEVSDRKLTTSSDYAKCQGPLISNSTTKNTFYSLLRSTCQDDGGAINALDTDDGSIGTYLMCDCLYSIRPACWINL